MQSSPYQQVNPLAKMVLELKCYAEDLLPLFKNMLAQAFEVGRLPPSLNQAIITLILKKDRDPTDCKKSSNKFDLCRSAAI